MLKFELTPLFPLVHRLTILLVVTMSTEYQKGLDLALERAP